MSVLRERFNDFPSCSNSVWVRGIKSLIHYVVKSLSEKKGAFVSESALHFDGDKPNSVPKFLRGMIIYLIRRLPDARSRRCGTVMRRYPRINPESLRGGSDRLPYLCFVLHRMGFFLPRELLRER